MKIAIDAMGGDLAPASPVEGAIAALREIPDDLQILLVGQRDLIVRELTKHGHDANPKIEIVDAEGIVAMTDKTSLAIRRKRDSSLLRAIQLHGNGDANAVVSAGHTGVQMAASYMTLGLIEGVRRPAIGHLFPVVGGRFCFVVDVGANTDCKPVNLLQFAIMGSVFMEIFAGQANPRVALLSIGEEKSKANELVSKSHYLLEESGLNFIGHVEGGDIFTGKTDVVVCDGFTGNILLKFAESVGFMILSRLKDLCGEGLSQSEAARRFQKEFDYSEIGGVPLLGVNGISVICHGRSNGKAIKNAIREAVAFCSADLPKALAGGIEQYNLGMLARGRARLKRLQEKREQHDVDEDVSDIT